MKKLVLLLLGVMLIGVSTLSAKMLPIEAVKLPVSLKEAIADNLIYPREAQRQYLEGDVWMKICVNEESKISIVDISSTNPELGEYVKNELSTLYLENIDCNVGQVYFLKVKFDLLLKE